MTSTQPVYTHNRCIACASEKSSKNICSQESFGKLMKFFWDGLSVDVKPMDSKNHEFCDSCSTKIIEFYDTNQVLVQLEKHLRTIQKTLIRTCVKGIDKLKEDGHPLLPVHKNLFEQWGAGFKSEDEGEKAADGENSVETFMEEGVMDEPPAPLPPPTVTKKVSAPKRRPTPKKRGGRSASKKKKGEDVEESSDFGSSTSDSDHADSRD